MIRHSIIIFFVAALLLLLTGIAAGVVLWCALRLVRRKGDAARSWLVVYKVSFALFVLALVISFGDRFLQAISMLLWVDLSFPTPISLWRIRDAHEHLLNFTEFFEELAVYLASVAILGLSAGIRVVHANRELPADRILRQASYGIAVPFGAISAVILGLSESQYAINGTFTTTWTLMLIITTIQFLFAILLLVWSVIIALRTKSELRVKTVSYLFPQYIVTVLTPYHPGHKYLRGCCVLLLVRASYGMVAIACRWFRPWMVLGYRADENPENWVIILFVVFRFWPVFALFVLLFALGMKKQYGLWANHQSYAMVNPDGQAMSQQARYSESQHPQDLSAPPSELYSSLLAHELYGSQLALEPPGQEHRSRQQLHELDVHNSPPTHSETTGLPASSNDKNKRAKVCVR